MAVRYIPTEDVMDYYDGTVPDGRIAVGYGGRLYRAGEVIPESEPSR